MLAVLISHFPYETTLPLAHFYSRARRNWRSTPRYDSRCALERGGSELRAISSRITWLRMQARINNVFVASGSFQSSSHPSVISGAVLRRWGLTRLLINPRCAPHRVNRSAEISDESLNGEEAPRAHTRRQMQKQKVRIPRRARRTYYVLLRRRFL